MKSNICFPALNINSIIHHHQLSFFLFLFSFFHSCCLTFSVMCYLFLSSLSCVILTLFSGGSCFSSPSLPFPAFSHPAIGRPQTCPSSFRHKSLSFTEEKRPISLTLINPKLHIPVCCDLCVCMYVAVFLDIPLH